MGVSLLHSHFCVHLITKTKLHSLNRFVFVLPVFGNCAHNYRTLWNNKNSCSIDIISSLLFKNKSVCSIARPHLSIRNEKTPKSLRQVSTVFLCSQNSGFYSLGEFCSQTALFKLSRWVTAGIINICHPTIPMLVFLLQTRGEHRKRSGLPSLCRIFKF